MKFFIICVNKEMAENDRHYMTENSVIWKGIAGIIFSDKYIKIRAI